LTEDGSPENVRRPSGVKLYGLILLMILLWAMNFLISKIALREIPPMLLAGMRTALAGVLILPVYFWRRRRDPGRTSWSRDEFPVLLFLGLVGVALNQFFFVVGISRTSVAHAAFIIGTTPLLVLALSAVVGHEKLAAMKSAGMLIALSGVMFLNLAPSKSPGATAAGDALILLSSLCFAVFTVAGKRATQNHGAVAVNTVAYVGGALALSPLTMWQAWRFPFAAVSWTAWACLCYMAVFPSLVCYLIYYYALTHISASRLSAFGYLQPLIATTAAAFILREPVTTAIVAGGAMVLAGVFVSERR
jgi:drug/metabolite transporter (DMT)-like permease